MSKLLRKILLFTLAALLAVAGPLTSLAAPSDSMETALVAVKTLLGIDDSVYTDFNYSSYYSDYDSPDSLTWTFMWSSAEGSSIYATATADGTLTYFSKYSYPSGSYGFAEISRTQAEKAAADFIKKAAPETYTYYKEPYSVSVSLNSDTYTLIYNAESGGYPFDAAQLWLNVDKCTGEVTSYSGANVNPAGVKFEESSKLISSADAVKAFASKIGLSLEYRSYFDYETKELTVFPVYILGYSGGKYISATTGEVVEYVYDGGDGGYSATAESPAMAANDAAGGGRSILTPSEIAAIEKTAGFLTSEEAVEKLLSAAGLSELDPYSAENLSVTLGRDYFDSERFFYTVSMYSYSPEMKVDDVSDFYGRIDAETGRVLSFSSNYFDILYSDGKTLLTTEQAEKAAVDFLKKIAPEEFAKTKLEAMPNEISPNRYGYISNYYFQFVRYENGVPFKDNAINVSVDPVYGKIMSYNLNWYDNAQFPGVGGALTPEAAMSEYVAQAGSEIGYITTGGGEAKLVYKYVWQYIDPESGKVIDYKGDPYEINSETPDYTDVKGHPSESYVTTLVDNGVWLWGGKFEPERKMTRSEFMSYLLLADSQSYYRYEPLTYFPELYALIDGEEDTLVTRQEAAKLAAVYLGFEKLAERHEWFVYPFDDAIADEYKGYVTICCMLGIVTSGGDFGPTTELTRAEAAVMLHNLILSKS